MEQTLQVDVSGLGVDVVGGSLEWCWMESIKGEDIAQAVRRWQEKGIEVVV